MDSATQRPNLNSFFIEDVAQYMSTQESTEAVLEQLNNEYRKFKYLEGRLVDQRENLKEKIPDIERTLNAVKHLQKQAETQKTNFELTNGLWIEAEIPKAEHVFLWLGANVMVEYSHEEAVTLLSNNLEQGIKSLEKAEDDLAYMKDQITVTEVNIARVYNWGVKQRRTGGAPKVEQ
eukprot:TRINITY_DN1437_c0_g1_i1.p1 TRINITY_DN1437_c0_g1~~TRINITY_DN1437_c0_g1_i1.p1  ORF type:complete len:184 (+),score=50.68 TRINITY_DN1437_c0_g1_i1:22-552(+)